MYFEPPFIVYPKARHEYSIIILHGRGSGGWDFAVDFFQGTTSANKDLLHDLSPHCKWIFPSSPVGFSTFFQEELQEWFDVTSLTDPDAQHELQVHGLRQSVSHIHQIIAEETERMPPQRIILGGMGQGFGVAAHALFTTPFPLAGFFGLCGWIPTKALAIPEPEVIASLTTPVLVGHSKDDTVVDSRHGELACAMMNLSGFWTDFQLYGNDKHWITQGRGYDDLDDFLRRCLPPLATQSTYQDDPQPLL